MRLLCGILLHAAAPVILFGAAGIQLSQEDRLRRLLQEDGLVEWAEVLMLFAAAGFAVVAARRRRVPRLKRPARRLLILGALFFGLVALEEISWGQRLFGFATPSGMAERNVQGEFTLHNLEFVHRFRHMPFVLWGVGGLVLVAQRSQIAARSPGLMPLLPTRGWVPVLVLVAAVGATIEYGFLVYGQESAVDIDLRRHRLMTEFAELAVAMVAFAWAGRAMDHGRAGVPEAAGGLE
ncbi:MAG TPA: hypothetical protein VGC54_04510 [Planctomycetota bacterium]